MLVFDQLADVSPESGLCFRPLSPKLETKMYIIWKKYQVFTPIAEGLIDLLKERFSENQKTDISKIRTRPISPQAI